MRCGISTACFYPELTENAVKELADHGVKTMEIFLNTFRETTPAFAGGLRKILDAYGIKVVSVHPFTSSMESLLFFSVYQTRLEDGIEQYKQWYLPFMQGVGADILVLHGARQILQVEDHDYYTRYGLLREAFKREGAIVAQENVAPFKSHSPEFLRKMREYLNDDADFVLDIKQAVRAGQSVYDILDAMGGRVIHTHLSDHTGDADCLPIGEGHFDFREYFRRLRKTGFDGAAVIELYRENYQDASQLYRGLELLNTLI